MNVWNYFAYCFQFYRYMFMILPASRVAIFLQGSIQWYCIVLYCIVLYCIVLYWSCSPSLRCGEISSGTWSRKPGSFSKSKQAGFTCLVALEDSGDKRLVQLELACDVDIVASGHRCQCQGNPHTDYCWAGDIHGELVPGTWSQPHSHGGEGR